MRQLYPGNGRAYEIVALMAQRMTTLIVEGREEHAMIWRDLMHATDRMINGPSGQFIRLDVRQ